MVNDEKWYSLCVQASNGWLFYECFMSRPMYANTRNIYIYINNLLANGQRAISHTQFATPTMRRNKLANKSVSSASRGDATEPHSTVYSVHAHRTVAIVHVVLCACLCVSGYFILSASLCCGLVLDLET